MGLYLYAIGGPALPSPGSRTGVDDAPVHARSEAGFTLWVSTLDRAPSPTLDRVRQHNRVVAAACEEHTPLPVRFGQWFEADALVSDLLRARGEALRRGLDRVEGCMEVGVRILDPDHAPSPPDRTTGRAYVEALARQKREREEQARRGRAEADRLRGHLGALVRDERVRAPGGAGTLASVAHLVARHDIGAHGAGLADYQTRRPGIRLVRSGPWPPYGFVDE